MNRIDHQMQNDVASPERRKILGFAVAAINFALISAIVGPVVGFVISPMRRKKKGQWVSILDETLLAMGEVKEVTFSMQIKDGYQVVDRKYTLYLRRSDEGVVCIDPACTHLGCRVRFQSDKHRFVCPCHGGVFSEDGKVVSGPPPKPLEQHKVKVESGKIWIYKET